MRRREFAGVEGNCLFFFFTTKRINFLFPLVAKQHALKGKKLKLMVRDMHPGFQETKSIFSYLFLKTCAIEN